MNYTGWLYDATKPDFKGLEFDTTDGDRPSRSCSAADRSSRAGIRGIVGMKIGGLRRLVVPPSLGYGSTRYGSIPPNAALVFEIALKA